MEIFNEDSQNDIIIPGVSDDSEESYDESASLCSGSEDDDFILEEVNF